VTTYASPLAIATAGDLPTAPTTLEGATIDPAISTGLAGVTLALRVGRMNVSKSGYRDKDWDDQPRSATPEPLSAFTEVLTFFPRSKCKKQLSPKDRPISLTSLKISSGAGEGIRTLDPNLGKVVLYP
jgi:hypothetical protein